MTKKELAKEIGTWILTALLVLMFANAGIRKFFENGGWTWMFRHVGFPDWFRIAIGVLETGAAALLLLPRTAAYGALTIIVVALMGRLLARNRREFGPGQVQEIPPYALPHWRSMLSETWERTEDILTIVTPLLVGGSVVLALLHHVGADAAINALFTPVTAWWLGLPAVLGVPILFGVLRKELSLLMIYQALGTFDVGTRLDWVQITTFLLFLTFYIPCISTFAVMLKTIGRKDALVSVLLSVGVALLVSGAVRLLLEGVNLFSA